MTGEEHDDRVERYLTHRMSGKELEEFEDQLMLDPELQKELHTVEALRFGLRANADLLSDKAVKPERAAWKLPTAMAASFLVGVLMLPLFQSSADLAIQSEVRLDALRSTQAPVFKNISGPVLISIDTGLLSDRSFKVVEIKTGDAVVQTFSDVRSIDGWLQLVIHDLKPGSYSVSLTEMTGDVVDRPFEIVE